VGTSQSLPSDVDGVSERSLTSGPLQNDHPAIVAMQQQMALDSTGYTNTSAHAAAESMVDGPSRSMVESLDLASLNASSSHSSKCAALRPNGTCTRCKSEGTLGLFGGKMDKCSSSSNVVKLRIYRLSPNRSINTYAHYAVKAIGGGGLYHVGVKAFGTEVSFGYGKLGTGVYIGDMNHMHHFSEEYDIGLTSYSEREFKALIRCLQDDPDWHGQKYDVLYHNCINFSKYVINTMFHGDFHNCGFSMWFSNRGKCCMPSWASRAARIGQKFTKPGQFAVKA
jgi:hypothetical protein